MAPVLSIISMVCISLAAICGIATFGTTSWVKACLQVSDILKASKHLTDSHTFSLLNSSLSRLKYSQICYNSGIFLVAIEIPGEGISMTSTLIPNTQDMFLHVVRGLLVVSVLLLLVSLAFFGLSIKLKSTNNDKQILSKSYCRIAVGILLVGTILYGAGMVTYTAKQLLNSNYKDYMVQVGPSFTAASHKLNEASGLTGFGGNSFISGLGRKRRQADLDHLVTPMLGLTNRNSFVRQRYFENIGDRHYYNDIGGHKDLTVEADKALEDFNKMDPGFSYSFFVAWFGVMFAIVALIYGVLESKDNLSINYDRQPLSVLQ